MWYIDVKYLHGTGGEYDKYFVKGLYRVLKLPMEYISYCSFEGGKNVYKSEVT